MKSYRFFQKCRYDPTTSQGARVYTRDYINLVLEAQRVLRRETDFAAKVVERRQNFDCVVIERNGEQLPFYELQNTGLSPKVCMQDSSSCISEIIITLQKSSTGYGRHGFGSGGGAMSGARRSFNPTFDFQRSSGPIPAGRAGSRSGAFTVFFTIKPNFYGFECCRQIQRRQRRSHEPTIGDQSHSTHIGLL